MNQPEELDKVLNSKSGFEHLVIDVEKQVRLLRISPPTTGLPIRYTLQTFHLEDLKHIRYRAVSYIWGHAHTLDEVHQIKIDHEPFFVRRSLFDFLTTASAKCESGLFFIDAICINQIDFRERQFQVQNMATIFRCADEVVAWLGTPTGVDLDDICALSQSKRRDRTVWAGAQWRGFKYLSYHQYWSRIWIAQEVLLAAKMIIWCGVFTFPLSLFGGTPVPSEMSSEAKVGSDGRPAKLVTPLSKLRSPAATIITHRLRLVMRPRWDSLAQGTVVGTMDEMMTKLGRPYVKPQTYQSYIPDRLCHVIHKFGRLECSDPRDRLYGLLGILDERSRRCVVVDYSKDVKFAIHQALKLGLEELYDDCGTVVLPRQLHPKESRFMGFYCDVRDAFGITDGESLEILREVLNELGMQNRLENKMFEAQWFQQDMWESNVLQDLQTLLAAAQPEEPVRERGWHLISGGLFRCFLRTPPRPLLQRCHPGSTGQAEPRS